MRRFRLPNNSIITEQALRDFYARVRELISERDNNDGLSIAEKTLGALDRFFNRLGKPQFEHTELLPDDPVIAEDLNEIFTSILNDVSVGYDEVSLLREAAISIHNYGSMHIAELKRRSDEVAGLVTDLRLLSDQHGEEVIVFSDTFVDDSKLDPAFPLEHLPAMTMPGQGSLTLNRQGVNNLSEQDIEITVTPIGDISREPNLTNIGRFYEGHFYSYLGEAEPEGGVFHLKEKLNQETLEGLDQAAFEVPELVKGKSKRAKKKRRKLKKSFVVEGGFEAKFLEQLQEGLYEDKFGDGKKGRKRYRSFVAKKRKLYHRKDKAARRQALYFAKNPEEAERAGVDSPEVPLTADNFLVMDLGGSEEELMDVRLNMLDGNPASYWQCELVRETNVIQDYVVAQIGDEESAEVSAAELRDLARGGAVDKEDFEVDIVFTLEDPQSMNWITLLPMTFDDGAYMEVTDVSTSPDLESEFVSVESFSSNLYSNILTPEANEELSKDVATYLLAPSRNSYRGSGIWPFAQRTVQQVRVRIKQRTPVPNPYEKLVFEAERTQTKKARRRRA